MSKAIDKIRKAIAKERASSLAKKKKLDALLVCSKDDSSNTDKTLFTIVNSIDNDFKEDGKYLVAKDIIIYHEGSVVDEYGIDYIAAKGSIQKAIDYKLEEDVDTIIVNANHARYEYDFNSGYIGDIDVSSLRAEYDENGRAMLKADIKLFKEHSIVKDMFVQGQDLSVSIENDILAYSYKKIDESGNIVDDNDIEPTLIVEEYSISGLAIVAYPRIASTTNEVKLKKLNEENDMSKKLKEELDKKTLNNSEDVEDQEDQKVEDQTEEVKDQTEDAEDQAESENENEDAEDQAEQKQADNAIIDLQNSMASLTEERDALNNSVKELTNAFEVEKEARIKAEADVTELKNSIEALNKQFTSINSGAKIENRNAKSLQSYEINMNDARGFSVSSEGENK